MNKNEQVKALNEHEITVNTQVKALSEEWVKKVHVYIYRATLFFLRFLDLLWLEILALSSSSLALEACQRREKHV